MRESHATHLLDRAQQVCPVPATPRTRHAGSRPVNVLQGAGAMAVESLGSTPGRSPVQAGGSTTAPTEREILDVTPPAAVGPREGRIVLVPVSSCRPDPRDVHHVGPGAVRTPRRSAVARGRLGADVCRSHRRRTAIFTRTPLVSQRPQALTRVTFRGTGSIGRLRRQVLMLALRDTTPLQHSGASRIAYSDKPRPVVVSDVKR